MGQAKQRGTYEERKATASCQGRIKKKPAGNWYKQGVTYVTKLHFKLFGMR